MRYVGFTDPRQFREVTRAHVLAWRKDLEERAVAGATIRRKLAALSSLFQHLCEVNAVLHNPVDGVKRPKVRDEVVRQVKGASRASFLGLCLDEPASND